MRIVIVGGGFGGVKAALQLAKDSQFHITLVSDRDHFLYYPTLYSTATGGSRRESIILLSTIFDQHPNVRVVIDTIKSVDPERKSLIGKLKTYHYDSAILALGVVTTYFGIKGLKENSFGIKSYKELQKLKKHLHDEASVNEHMDKCYVVVGAGATGVELSAELSHYLRTIAKNHGASKRKIRIKLVEAAPRVLPRMHPSISRKVEKHLRNRGIEVETNQKVEGATHEDITIGGKKVHSHTVIWTSGVANHPFFKRNDHVFNLSPNGRVVVDEYMRAASNIHVIGDNAFTSYSGLAQTALHDAHFVANNLIRFVNNKPLKRYSSRRPPVVVPAGSAWAAFEWGKIHFTGAPAAAMRYAADLIGYSDVLPIGHAVGRWESQFHGEETCPRCDRALL